MLPDLFPHVLTASGRGQDKRGRHRSAAIPRSQLYIYIYIYIYIERERYIYIYIHTYIHTYIYIYHRERDVYMHIYIYIYIHVYLHRKMRTKCGKSRQHVATCGKIVWQHVATCADCARSAKYDKTLGICGPSAKTPFVLTPYGSRWKFITGFQTGSGQTGFYRSAINSHNNAIIRS